MYIVPERVLDMKSIVEFIKESRKKNGLSQEELAFKAGVGLRFMRELERGKTTVQLDKVNDVLNMFGKEVGVINKQPDHDK
ncbi:y4mF family transcriptional regulator [Pedobacter metabolipauper]|uniref:Y4mF family transcriptional regulator n=2 Tax=Pedobacter metabolipauper TaxID=425513 RepID=A0A4R6SSE0_9SPHI|nr:y4mF family transcriptional regulator [Pedobacter metabolipauper]